MRNPNYTKEILEPIVKDSKSFAEVIRKLNLKQGGGTQYVLKLKLEKFQIDTSHFSGALWSKGKNITTDNRIGHKNTIENTFCKNSLTFRSRLRDLIIKLKLFPYECLICKLKDWNNKTISLHLDHINGINNDNRIENLRWLCPNCHSQTETYCRKK